MPSSQAGPSSAGRQVAGTNGKAGADDVQLLARQAAISLLSYLLATPPYLPASVKSKDLKQRHQLLNLSPEDAAEDYLVTDCYPFKYRSVPAKTLKLLRSLGDQVEEQGKDLDRNALISNVRWQGPEPTKAIVAVDLGSTKHGREPLLTLITSVEGRPSEVENYKYDNLLPCDVPTGEWRKDLDELTSHVQIDATKEASTATEPGSKREEALQTSISSAPVIQNQRTGELEHDLRGSASGPAAEFYTDPKEFWEGVSDDEQLNVGRQGKEGTSKDDKVREEEEAERQYWARYEEPGAHADSAFDDEDDADARRSRERRGIADEILAADPLQVRGSKAQSSLSSQQGGAARRSDPFAAKDDASAAASNPAPAAVNEKENAIKLIIEGAWRLSQQQSNLVSRDDFLRLAREAVDSSTLT